MQRRGKSRKTHPMTTKTKDGLVLQEGLGFCWEGRARSWGKQRIGWKGTQGADHKRGGERETKIGGGRGAERRGRRKKSRGKAEQKGKGGQRGSKARGMGQI